MENKTILQALKGNENAVQAVNTLYNFNPKTPDEVIQLLTSSAVSEQLKERAIYRALHLMKKDETLKPVIQKYDKKSGLMVRDTSLWGILNSFVIGKEYTRDSASKMSIAGEFIEANGDDIFTAQTGIWLPYTHLLFVADIVKKNTPAGETESARKTRAQSYFIPIDKKEFSYKLTLNDFKELFFKANPALRTSPKTPAETAKTTDKEESQSATETPAEYTAESLAAILAEYRNALGEDFAEVFAKAVDICNIEWFFIVAEHEKQ